MSEIDFFEKIKVLDKDLKIHWERTLLKNSEGNLKKDDLREFKSEILIPILDKITDLSLVILERQRKELYEPLRKFFKNCINYSTYYQRTKQNQYFNFCH